MQKDTLKNKFELFSEEVIEKVARKYRESFNPENIETPIFILILGPSAVGKSTVINKLLEIYPDKLEYVTPYTTRSLRKGEENKISIDMDKFIEMEEKREFVVVNNLYNIKYGTPKKLIHKIIKDGKIPILDFPLDRIDAIKNSSYGLFTIYLFPQNGIILENRIIKERGEAIRVDEGMRELAYLLELKDTDERINYSIVNYENRIENTISYFEEIIDKFIN